MYNIIFMLYRYLINMNVFNYGHHYLCKLSLYFPVTEGGLSLGQVLGIIVGCVTAFILVMILVGVLIHIGYKRHVARLEAHGSSSRRATSNFTTLA